MVVFFGFVTIGVVTGYLIAYCTRGTSRTDKVNAIMLGTAIGMALGVGVSFWGGSLFVKKEIVVEKYVILPMFFDGKPGKPIAALIEENDTLSACDNYIFQTKGGDKIKFIKHFLYKKNIFFNLNEDEERYLEIKRSKTCKRRMWVWFFYGGTGTIESKAVLRKEDSFLILPKYYSF